MYFANLQDAWAMGGHGPYVWAAVGLTLAVFAWLALRELLAQCSFRARERRRLLAETHPGQES